jgi:hypothetical protein
MRDFLGLEFSEDEDEGFWVRRFLERFAGTIEEEVEEFSPPVVEAVVVEGEEVGAEEEVTVAAAALRVEVDWGTRWEMVCSPMERRWWNWIEDWGGRWYWGCSWGCVCGWGEDMIRFEEVEGKKWNGTEGGEVVGLNSLITGLRQRTVSRNFSSENTFLWLIV